MTVKALLEQLQFLDPDAEVRLAFADESGNGGRICALGRVEISVHGPFLVSQIPPRRPILYQRVLPLPFGWDA